MGLIQALERRVRTATTCKAHMEDCKETTPARHSSAAGCLSRIQCCGLAQTLEVPALFAMYKMTCQKVYPLDLTAANYAK